MQDHDLPEVIIFISTRPYVCFLDIRYGKITGRDRIMLAKYGLDANKYQLGMESFLDTGLYLSENLEQEVLYIRWGNYSKNNMEVKI